MRGMKRLREDFFFSPSMLMVIIQEGKMMMQKGRYFSNMKELQENRKGLSIFFLFFFWGHIHLIKHKIGVWGSRKVSVPGLTSQNHLRAALFQMPTSQRLSDFVWVILDTCNKEVFQNNSLLANISFCFQ